MRWALLVVSSAVGPGEEGKTTGDGILVATDVASAEGIIEGIVDSNGAGDGVNEGMVDSNSMSREDGDADSISAVARQPQTSEAAATTASH